MCIAAMLHDSTVDKRLRFKQTGWMYKVQTILDFGIVVKITYRVSVNPVLSVNQYKTIVIKKLTLT